MLEIQDEQLIQGCKKQDPKAQKQLYEKYYSQMMGVCMRYTNNLDDGADLLNQGFLKVFQKINDFKNEGAFGGWIRRIMVNVAIDHTRKNKKFAGNVEIDTATEVMVDSFVVEKMAQDEIFRLIKLLPENLKIVLNLYVFENYTHREISEELGISEGTSKWYLSEARKKLASEIEKRNVNKEEQWESLSKR